MKEIKTDFLIIGAGIIGLCLAKNLTEIYSDKKICIIEKEKTVGCHASGRNSGVLHAGFYYYPNSLKAKFTKQGNEELTNYCLIRGLKINKCGKVVVAKSEEELESLFELKKRGERNKVEIYLITEKELKEIEPNAKTYKYALWSPNTSTVNPSEILLSLLKELKEKEVKVFFNTPYKRKIEENVVEAGNYIFQGEKIINAAGLYADKIAKDFGFSKNYVLIPFKGVYLEYEGSKLNIKRNIYPVPNLKNPFLGVHFTIKVDGTIKIGPTATPCFWRENYKGLSGFNISELLEILKFDIKLFMKNENFRKIAFDEVKKYLKSYMLKEASKLVKDFDLDGFIHWGTPGIRAQLIDIRNLQLVHDFVVEGDERSIHILNAISPAFTASLPFTRFVVQEYILKSGGEKDG
ncbi:MAG: L-2-hydroxyglutarate oxidase LhgO [Thermodesulfobacterium sp.]|uniref:L-2-hydroxyglutarate oxidase LhgO n=1 Tax=Candidatus Thermodesulfobacterium syntrophicum TaxID=3060442 RepID=A0AAE3TDW0_9BACT|nr:L-2-hydroxyglutarate oxidase LhgO [Candidatus Thermodesulfobacterium syntrophicum]